MIVCDMVLDEVRSRKSTVDFETTIGGDPGAVEYETKVMKQGTDSMYFEINRSLQSGVVVDDEHTVEPGTHYMVEEIVFAGLSGERLSGAYTGEKELVKQLAKWLVLRYSIYGSLAYLQRCVDDGDVGDYTRRLLIETGWDDMLETKR